jgi:4-amino-4-deoxy-L-arabinose transferase-like glycosyltransferase
MFFIAENLAQEKKHSRFGSAFLILVFLSFIILSFIHIDRPGIQYDEILFGNAALGGIDDSFIKLKLGNFPIMLMPYIGALKAYIYYPIFKIFSVSVYTIRIPVIIIGVLTLLFTYKYVYSIFNIRTALITILFLACDPSFVIQNKLDWGPVSLSLFLKSISLFFFITGVNRRRKKYFVFFVLFLGLGLFNKLDFIWFINAMLFSILIFNFKKIISFLKENIKFSLIILLSALSFFSFILVYALRMSSTLFNQKGFFSFNLLERLKYQYDNFTWTLNGNGAYGFMTDTHLQFHSLFLLIGSFIVLIAFLIHFFNKTEEFNKWIKFFIVLLLTIVFQIYATDMATGTHHMMMIYPFPHIIVSFFMSKIIEDFRGNRMKLLIASGVYSSLAVIIISNLYVNYRYIDAFKHDKVSVMWSNAIYTLVDYVKENKEKTYVSVDWGLHNQLLTLTNGTVPLKEFVWTFKDLNLKEENKRQDSWLIDECVCKPNHVFLFHTDEFSSFLNAKKNFFHFLIKKNIRANLFLKLGNREKYFYELYVVDLNDCRKRSK